MTLLSLPSPAVMSALPVGVAFGFLLEKSKVYLPYLIMEQMRFRRFSMLEIFMTATATSAIAVLALDKAKMVSRQPRSSAELGFLIPGPFGANILGGLAIGFGMSMTGACPGTVYVQLGAGVPTAIYVLAGGLAAALVFGYASKFIGNICNRFMSKGSATTLYQVLGLSDTAVTAAFAALCLSVALTADRYLPWAVNAGQVTSMTASDVAFSFNPFNQVWSPIAAGIGIGATQLASLLTTGNSLGLSASYCVAAAHTARCIDGKADDNAPYLKPFLSPAAMGHALLAAGMMAGGWLSVLMSGATTYPYGRDHLAVNMVTPMEALIGGAVMVAGARLAGGCTSGHGISGMAMMGIASFVTVASMFAGGMLTVAIRDFLKVF